MTKYASEAKIAKTLIDNGVFGFSPQNPITFKSGIISPVYCDNRKLPFYPKDWQVILKGFEKLIEKKGVDFEVIAGIEAAGIPHSAALGYILEKPSVFCRKETKKHGTKKLVEGGDVRGKKVLLIEDLVTTGGSSLKGVESLRKEGASVTDCIVIVTYGFKESGKAFDKAKVKLHALTSFDAILVEAIKQNKISEAEAEMVIEWQADPWNWGK